MFAALLIAISAVLSLVTIIAIYREGGILKRLRATPLRPLTILTAHVLVKLLFTATTLILTMMLGRRFLAVDIPIPWVPFTAATVVSTLSILSLGFVLASVAPTARFAQPIGTIVLYPMVGISGLFVPVDQMPALLQLIARMTPASYAVSLMRGAWRGDSWLIHTGDLLGSRDHRGGLHGSRGESVSMGMRERFPNRYRVFRRPPARRLPQGSAIGPASRRSQRSGFGTRDTDLENAVVVRTGEPRPDKTP